MCCELVLVTILYTAPESEGRWLRSILIRWINNISFYLVIKGGLGFSVSFPLSSVHTHTYWSAYIHTVCWYSSCWTVFCPNCWHGNDSWTYKSLFYLYMWSRCSCEGDGAGSCLLARLLIDACLLSMRKGSSYTQVHDRQACFSMLPVNQICSGFSITREISMHLQQYLFWLFSSFLLIPSAQPIMLWPAGTFSTDRGMARGHDPTSPILWACGVELNNGLLLFPCCWTTNAITTDHWLFFLWLMEAGVEQHLDDTRLKKANLA